MAETDKRTTYRITDLAADERPRERLQAKGAAALNTAELLAILLRVGVPGENAVQVGQRLLHKFGGLAGIHQAPFEELCREHGIGEAKAAQIKAALELASRMEKAERTVITGPEDAAHALGLAMAGLEQEHLRVMLLNTRNHVLETVEVYKGSVNSSQVQVGEVFKDAVRRNAAAIIVAHNHPSGDPTPSPVIWRKSQGCWLN